MENTFFKSVLGKMLDLDNENVHSLRFLIEENNQLKDKIVKLTSND